MKIKMLTYALLGAGLLGACTLPAAAQGRGGMAGIISAEDRTAIREAIRDEAAKLQTDLQAAQKAAVEAALAKDANEADVKAKIEAVTKIQCQLAFANFKAVKKIVKFTDEQTTQMKETPMVGYMTLFGFGGGFGGGRGRRGGAGGGGGGQ